MDRLSYKDGYLKGIHQTLATLLEDGVISRRQYVDYKNDFFSDENRNYINELKQIKDERKNYMKNIIPLIKEIEKKSIYVDYNFKSIYEMLVDGVGIKNQAQARFCL